jgi:hypothetical protein
VLPGARRHAHRAANRRTDGGPRIIVEVGDRPPRPEAPAPEIAAMNNDV